MDCDPWDSLCAGSVVMVDTDLLPVFGVIKDIIINEMHCYYFFGNFSQFVIYHFSFP